jgi:predicted dehydrogenase
MNSPRFSRRSFLATTLAAGVAPLFLPARVWGANDRIAIGFIGIGKQMGGHITGLIGKDGTQAVAVCDVDTKRRDNGKRIVEEAYAKKKDAAYKGCDTHNDFRELLARKDIDAVVIATPDHWHAPIAIAAARAGKDIYCEKPLTNTIHEAQALTEEVKKTGRVFQVGSQQRSSPEFRIACELVRQGRIGKVSRVAAGFGGPGKACDLPEEAAEPGLDWNLWLGPAPLRAYNSELSPRGIHNHFPNWRKYWEYGGGMVTDWGAHHLDIAQWGLGMDDAGPVEMVPPADWEKAQAGGKLIYPGGVEVTHISENGVTFYGSEGEIYVNRGKLKVTLGGKVIADSAAEGGLKAALPLAEKEIDASKPRLYASTDHKADWLAAIGKRGPTICTVEIGARTVTACHLLNFGYRYGKSVKWDPAAWNFAGGTGDPAWLTREYREPWKV